jgi:hypothetical protein
VSRLGSADRFVALEPDIQSRRFGQFIRKEQGPPAKELDIRPQ